MKVSQFSSAFADTPVDPVPLSAILSAIKGGRWKKYIEELRKLEGKPFKEKKVRLPGFTASGIFSGKGNGGFVQHSGIVQIDLDRKDNTGLPYPQLWNKVLACPHVYAAFRSPSGEGVKALVKCPPDKDLHAGSYTAAVQWFAEQGVIVDANVSALSQLCFVSWDPDLYQNKEAVEIKPVPVDRNKAELQEYEEFRTEEEILTACAGQFDKFKQLWAGEYGAAGFDDHSEADHALICMLRENCFSNETVAELFERSGLHRENKWNGRTRDYVFHSLRSSTTVQTLAMFDRVPEDPEDPEPERPRKRKGWAWELARDVGEWCQEQEDYVVKRLFYKNSLSCIYGPPGSAKTFFVFSLAAAIASGREWNGFRVKRTNVLYFGLEGERGIRKRMQGLIKEGQLADDAPFARVLFQRDAMNLMNADHVKKTVDTIRAYEAETGITGGILFIDTLAKATPGGDENSAKDMGVALAHAEMIKERTGWCICVIHHSGKEAGKGPRGSTAIVGGLDTLFEVVRHDDDPMIRIWQSRKQRDEEEKGDVYARLKIIGLGVDEDGDDVTTCVLEFITHTDLLVKPEKRMNNVMAVLTVEGVAYEELQKATGMNKFHLNKKLKELETDGNIRRKDGRIYLLPEPMFDNLEEEDLLG